jgi:hypothetical protein
LADQLGVMSAPAARWVQERDVRAYLVQAAGDALLVGEALHSSEATLAPS